VIVELDSWRFHGDRTAFDRDRERDVASLQSGYITIRETHQRLTANAEDEASRLRAILNQRG
jgi:very-short-patch-repair endonuclease